MLNEKKESSRTQSRLIKTNHYKNNLKDIYNETYEDINKKMFQRKLKMSKERENIRCNMNISDK